MSEYIQTTPEDFEAFKEECWKWINIFGLKNYAYRFYHNDEDPDAFAWYQVHTVHQIAVITLTETWRKKDYSREQVRKSAFHEVCEVLLANIVLIAESRNFCQNALDGEAHKIIRILENTLFDEIDG